MREDLDNQGSKLANDELVEFDLIKLKIFKNKYLVSVGFETFFSFFCDFYTKSFQ